MFLFFIFCYVERQFYSLECSCTYYNFFFLTNDIHWTAYPHKWQFCSNDDPIFGQASLSDADELWSSSSKEMPNSPIKLFPTLGSQNLESGVDTQQNKNPENLKQNELLSTLASGRVVDAGSLGLQTGGAILTNVDGDTSGAIAKDRVLLMLN